MMTHLIGVAGGTGAGKTALVLRLAEVLGEAAVVDLDSYYLDRSGVSPAERGRLNYDEPGAIDIGLLLAHLHRMVNGDPVEKPRYAFSTHTRSGVETLEPAPVILVDGLFTLWWSELRDLLDLKVFVDAPADLRLARRLQRDVTERGRDAESVLAQYLGTVRAMHKRYIEPTRHYADLIVHNTGGLDECVTQVLAAIRNLKPGRYPAAGGVLR